MGSGEDGRGEDKGYIQFRNGHGEISFYGDEGGSINFWKKDAIQLVMDGKGLYFLRKGGEIVGVRDVYFKDVYCKNIVINEYDSEYGYKRKGIFGVSPNNRPMLIMYGDDLKAPVAYLGENKAENDEIMFLLNPKSETDKRIVSMYIGENGGRLNFENKMGEQVVRIGVHSDGGGLVDLRDKFGYVK